MAWLVGDEAQASPSKVIEIRFFEHAGKMVRDAPKEKNMKRNI